MDVEGSWTLKLLVADSAQSYFIDKCPRADETNTSVTLIYGGDFARVACKTNLNSGDVLHNGGLWVNDALYPLAQVIRRIPLESERPSTR